MEENSSEKMNALRKIIVQLEKYLEKNKKLVAQYPKADWSEGSYHDTMRKLADKKRKRYGTTCSYNGY